MADATAGQPARQPRRRRRLIVGLAIGVFLVLALVLAGLVVRQAWAAKGSLEQAQQHLGDFREALREPDGHSTTAVHKQLQADTAQAVEQTRGVAWWLYERVPVVGANLAAFRQTAELLDALVRDGIGPLAQAVDGVSLDSLKPHDGGIDIRPLRKLAPATDELDDAVRAANAAASSISTTFLVGPLKEQVVRLQTQLSDAAPALHTLRTAMPVLYPALGGEGPRRYLLIFQNNAEERASGGNPASMAMLTVHNGRFSLGRQASSTDFPHPYPKPPYTPSGPGNGDWDSIYTDYASSYVTNITMTPDFPSTAKMARAMWQDVVGGPVDGVISFDPVALSYLLEATGPVELADGYTIDSSNAVAYLLSEVYAKYPDSRVQDAVFASAADAIFTAVTNGQGDTGAYLAALRPIVAEQRLKVWSVRKDEQALLGPSPVGHMLPVGNDAGTVLGVYNNDDATSKMSYYMDERVEVAINRCEPDPTYTVTATVTNTLPAATVDTLPEYVKPHQARIVPGGDRQWVQLYGPAGSRLVSATIDGEPVVWGTNLRAARNTNKAATGVDDRRPAVQGTMYGRPVGVVSINLGPESSKTVQAVFAGSRADNTEVTVSHTPKVRPVPVDIETECAG